MTLRLALVAVALAGCFIKPNPDQTGSDGGTGGDGGSGSGSGSGSIMGDGVHDYVFVSRTKVPLGVDGHTFHTAADLACQMEGMEMIEPAGTFVAWVGETTMRADQAITDQGARGFLRPDGAPIAVTIGELEKGAILNPILEYADRTPVPPSTVVTTFTIANGMPVVDPQCFTASANGSVVVGSPYRTTNDWTFEDTSSCDANSVYCVQVNHANEIVLPPLTQRKVVVSRQHSRMMQTDPDFACQDDASAVGSAGNWLALVARNNVSATSHAGISPGVMLQRLDGVTVSIDGLHSWLSTIHEDFDGVYVNEPIVIGASTVTMPDLGDNNCTNWTDTTQGTIGFYSSHLGFTEGTPAPLSCGTSEARYICVSD